MSCEDRVDEVLLADQDDWSAVEQEFFGVQGQKLPHVIYALDDDSVWDDTVSVDGFD